MLSLFQRKKKGRDKMILQRFIYAINILSGLLHLLETGAIIIAMQNFSGSFPKTTAEKLQYFMNVKVCM